MKKIGLIGGMSCQSTLEYYRLLNEDVNKRLGGLNSAEIVMISLNFAEIAELMDRADWQEIAYILAQARADLEITGAEVILLCSNTIHHAVPLIRKFSSFNNFLHIAEVTAKAVVSCRISEVALLGTKFTMTQNFYKESLRSRGLTVLTPEEDDMDFIDSVIFEELCQGVINPESKKRIDSIICSLVNQGAEGVILGCTELPLLVNQNDFIIPIFDTMRVHVEAAVDLALAE